MGFLRHRLTVLQRNYLRQNRHPFRQCEENVSVRSLRATAARRGGEIERDRALELTLEVLKRKQQGRAGGTTRRLTSGIYQEDVAVHFRQRCRQGENVVRYHLHACTACNVCISPLTRATTHYATKYLIA